jgi:hypothetical protein
MVVVWRAALIAALQTTTGFTQMKIAIEFLRKRVFFSFSQGG